MDHPIQGEKPSLVLELHRLASEGTIPLTDVLRKALIVATKLRIEDFRVWISDELTGYVGKGKEIPKYRYVRGLLVGRTAFNDQLPLRFQDSEMESACSVMPMADSAAELEQLAQSERFVSVTFPANIVTILRSGFPGLEFLPQLLLPAIAIQGICDKIRTIILEWSLKLEEEGILGEGMSFSDDEKRRAAAAPNIHIEKIGQFYGNLGGSITAETVQIGNYSSIHEQLKQAGILQSERNQLEDILDGLKKAKHEEKPPLLKRGMEWVDKNKAQLGTLAVQVGAWFTGHDHH